MSNLIGKLIDKMTDNNLAGKSNVKYWLISGVVVIGLVVISYFAWTIGREINYTFAYEAQVKESICEMVKPEYLINPSECKK